jgi:molybdate transport system permease protein
MDYLHFSPAELEALRLSAKVASVAVIASLPFGVAAAWVISRYNFPGKAILNGVIHLPLVLPPVVIGYVLLVLLGRKGLIGEFLYDRLGISFAFDWKGAALAAAVMAFPLMVRSIRLSFEAQDRGIEQAARTLGAGPFRVFCTITLPLITPGIIAGMVLAFARGLGEFGATIILVSNIAGQTRTLPLALYTLIQTPGGEAGAMRLCLLAVLLSLAALIISEIMTRRFISRMEG